jgi:prevent-host-death family protein
MGVGTVVSVREAKARFSAMVARAAAGEEITIAWHGVPRARLAPLPLDDKIFHVDRAWLRSMPVHRQSSRSEDLVRADREGRG